MTSPSSQDKKARIGRLLSPRTIAVIGASDKPGSLGNSVVANLDREGFAGEIYLVNPKRERIGERPCFPDIDALPQAVDVAILAIPQAMVVDTIAALARNGAGAAIIYSAGFAEGGEEGLAQQREIQRLAQDAGMVIEGPNCLGLVNFRNNIPLTFIQLPPATAQGDRRVGIVSQSGAMAAIVATNLIARDIPLSCYISTGNEAESGVEDFLDYLVDDAETQVIAMMVEHFRNPAQFLSVARRATAAGKRIVLLHPGKSEAGRESAATHTGAMVGDYATMQALVEQAGVTLVNGLEELGDVAEMLLLCQTPPGKDVAVVTESGALKALTLDFAEALKIELPKLTDSDSPSLRAALPSFVPVTNPMDITAQGLVDPGIYKRTIAALAEDDRIGTIVVAIIQTDTHTAHIKFSAIAEAITEMAIGKPVIVAGVDEGGRVLDADIAALREAGVPYYPTPERVLRALSSLASRREKALVDESLVPASLRDLPLASVIPEYRSKAALAEYGVAFSPYRMVNDLPQALGAAGSIGYPVVIKAQSADLAHKTEAGGVILNIRDEDELARAWDQLADNIAKHRPGLELDGVLVEKMAAKGVEMIVGARVDHEWGPIIMAGFGGVAAELLHDVVLLPPNLPRQEIINALLGLRMAPLLTGFRGAPVADIEAFATLIQNLGRVLLGTPEIREIDLNPVLAFPKGQGVVALDALIST